MKEFYPKKGRVILHVDMNSFFASVEMAYDPALKGKPLAIAGDEEQRKGIVVTCSYEARKFGVKTTMPVWQAKKLCPSLIVIRPNMERYVTASQTIFAELRQFTSLVEPVSIDEGYLDITESYHLGTPIEIAEKIQRNLLKQLDLPCSIGIAPNKFLAKMASDMKKPLGITILRKRDIEKVIWPLPTIQMHGIGEKTAEKLSNIHIHTIKELANSDDHTLRATLGIRGIQLKMRANGIDPRQVDPEAASENKSIGRSITLPKDSTKQSELLTVLKELSKGVAIRLRKKGYLTQNIAITIRYKDRRTISRGKKLMNPIRSGEDIYQIASQLLIDNWNGEPIRLLGVTGQDLVEEDQMIWQLDLFSYEKAAREEPLYKAMDEIKSKYGQNSLQKGRDFIKRNKRSARALNNDVLPFGSSDEIKDITKATFDHLSATNIEVSDGEVQQPRQKK